MGGKRSVLPRPEQTFGYAKNRDYVRRDPHFFCADPIQGPAVLNRRPLRKSIFAAPTGRPALQPGKDGVAALGGVKEVDAGDGRNGQLAIVRVVEVKGEDALPELVAAVKTELVDHAQLRSA